MVLTVQEQAALLDKGHTEECGGPWNMSEEATLNILAPVDTIRGGKEERKAPGRAPVGPSQSSPQIPVSPVAVPDTVKQK